MITNVDKRIISVKDIPSNIIEEAIFILKSDISSGKNEKWKEKRKEIVKKETEDFLKDYLKQVDNHTLNNDTKSVLSSKVFQVALSGVLLFLCLIGILAIAQ